MNNPHQNARTTRLGRAEMIRRILEEGRPVREVAAGFGISERTARKWLARYRAEGPGGLDNRSSRPRTVANRTAEYWIGVIEMLRREYRLTAEEIAGKLKLARSTVAVEGGDLGGGIGEADGGLDAAAEDGADGDEGAVLDGELDAVGGEADAKAGGKT